MKTKISWYQSINKKHLQIHVEFDGGLSIPIARKWKSEKEGLFSKKSVLFPNGGVFKMLWKIGTFLKM
jgi:hypothetical protein